MPLSLRRPEPRPILVFGTFIDKFVNSCSTPMAKVIPHTAHGMAMETNENAAAETDISHPELHSRQEIINPLSERCQLRVDDAVSMDKAMLVSLFQRTVMPLPQRVPRTNRRGRRTKALIKRLDVRKPKPVEKSTEYQNPKRTSGGKKGLLISSDLNLTSGTRLKPPPIVLNKKRALLKLGSSPTSANNSVSLIRTGVAKVSLSKWHSGDKSSTPEERSKDEVVSPRRTKITLSGTKSDETNTGSSTRTRISPPNLDQNNGFGVSVGSTEGDSEYKVSTNNTRRLGDPEIGAKRTYITFSDSEQTSASSRLKVSGAAKDAVRKALLGHSSVVGQKTPARPAAQTSPENDGSSEKKRKKITWP